MYLKCHLQSVNHFFVCQCVIYLCFHRCNSPSTNPSHCYTARIIPGKFGMMTSSNGNIFRVTGPLRGESTGRRFAAGSPRKDQWVTRSFDVVFDLRFNKRLSKLSRHCWLETPSRSLYVTVMQQTYYSWQIWGNTLRRGQNGRRFVFNVKMEIYCLLCVRWCVINGSGTGTKQVDGNLQKCVRYANLRMARASYAHLRIVRISWHVLDSANEKGPFKFNDNKNRAFVCKRWCNWSNQSSYQRAWLNHVYK